MYMVVIGGGNVGYYLTKELLAAGHEVVMIEKDPARARLIAENPQTGIAVETVLSEVVGGIRSEARKVSPDHGAARAADPPVALRAGLAHGARRRPVRRRVRGRARRHEIRRR